MGTQTKPFRGIHISTCCTALFGVISVIVGTVEACVWLAHLGYGVLGRNFYGSCEDQVVGDSEGIKNVNGGISGSGMVILTASGLWCGLWVIITGICGCCLRVSYPTDRNDRTRVAICVASALNAALLCPLQIGLYAWVFVPQEEWAIQFCQESPMWWAATLQGVGIASAVASLILCIINVILAIKTKAYTGETKTWSDFMDV